MGIKKRKRKREIDRKMVRWVESMKWVIGWMDGERERLNILTEQFLFHTVQFRNG